MSRKASNSFTWFGTRASKSQLNFLELLRAGHTDYVINEAAVDYMRGRALAGPVIRQLAAHHGHVLPIRLPGKSISIAWASALCK